MLPCDDDISFSYLKQAGRTVAQSFLQRPDFRPEILYKVLYAETDVK